MRILQVAADLNVLVEEALVIALSEPLGLPGPRDADAEADRIDLLSHLELLADVEDDSDVSGLLLDRRRPALRTGTEPPKHGALVHVYRLHIDGIDV